MVTMIDLAAGQGATELSAPFFWIEAPVDHGQPGLADGHTLFVDGIVGVLLLIRLGVALERNNRLDLPVFQKTIDADGVMGAIAAKRVDCDIGIQGSEFGQCHNTGDRVVPIGLNHTQIDRQVTLENRIVSSKDIGGMAVEVAVVVAIPAVTGEGIGEDTRTVTVIEALFPAGTLFAAPGVDGR